MRDSFTKGIMALMAAILLVSVLSSAATQENNAAVNNTMSKNITVLNKTNNLTSVETIQPATLPEGSSVLQIGKGMSGGAIGMSSLNEGNIAYPTKFQTNIESIEPALALGNPVKPMKDLEKVVFICNIM